MCVVCVPSLDRFNVCHGVRVYVCKCIVHEYLPTRFHLCNNESVLYVCICVCAQCFENVYSEQVHLHNNWIGMKMRRLARAMAKGKASCRERCMM